MKPKRHMDPEVIRLVKLQPCAACLKSPAGDAHHVKTVGSGGGDYKNNLMPLHRKAHIELHQIGLSRFANKYKFVRKWLIENGWTIDEWQHKWVQHFPENDETLSPMTGPGMGWKG